MNKLLSFKTLFLYVKHISIINKSSEKTNTVHILHLPILLKKFIQYTKSAFKISFAHFITTLFPLAKPRLDWFNNTVTLSIHSNFLIYVICY